MYCNPAHLPHHIHLVGGALDGARFMEPGDPGSPTIIVPAITMPDGTWAVGPANSLMSPLARPLVYTRVAEAVLPRVDGEAPEHVYTYQGVAQ